MKSSILGISLGLLVFFFQYSTASSETTPFKVHKFITAYDFNEKDIPFIASRFDLIDTELKKASQIEKMKGLNPSLKAIYYKNALTHQAGAASNRYVRDEKTGSRLANDDWGWYLMDIGYPFYRTSLANLIRNNLMKNPIFDGVFLDDVWGYATLGGFYREGTKERGTVPQSAIKYWRDNMKLLLMRIKLAIENKLLIINTGAFNTDYLSLSDGQMYEAFCHANWQPYGVYYPDWQKKLDSMIAISNSGKAYLAQSGIQEGAMDLDTKRTARYCFAMFLLGAKGNSYFYFSKNYRGVTYFPEWDVDLGSPMEDYHARAGTPTYERKYSKGLVLINPSSEPVQIRLEGSYKNLDGVITDTISLGSHEGDILLQHSEK